MTTMNNDVASPYASALSEGLAGDAEKEQSRCILRLRTTTWADAKGLHIKRSLVFLRRQCVGFNGLAEDAGAIGAESVVGRITNLAECKDGIYEAVVCNVSRDWEAGYVDDWDYKLVPISTSNVEVTGKPPRNGSRSERMPWVLRLSAMSGPVWP